MDMGVEPVSYTHLDVYKRQLCHDTFSAHACREHNDANILTMGERVIGPGLANDIVTIFMETEFEDVYKRQGFILLR